MFLNEDNVLAQVWLVCVSDLLLCDLSCFLVLGVWGCFVCGFRCVGLLCVL